MQNNVNELCAEANRKLELGQHEEANRCYDRALELDPHNAIIWYNKGSCLSKLSQYKKAIQCFEKALELDPHNVDIWLGYSRELVRLERFNEALRYYKKALKLNPKNYKALFNKAYLEDRLGNPRKAYKLFKRYIAFNPSNQSDQSFAYARQRVSERELNTKRFAEPQLLYTTVEEKRKNNLARLIQIAFGLLLVGFGYALTLLSPWLWLVAGPFILVTVILFRNAFLNLRFCPHCKKEIRAFTTYGKQVCPRCGKEFTLSSKK